MITSFGANEKNPEICRNLSSPIPGFFFQLSGLPGDDSIHDSMTFFWHAESKSDPFKQGSWYKLRTYLQGNQTMQMYGSFEGFPLNTVDGRDPAPPGMYETLQLMGSTTNLNWWTQDFWTINSSTLFGLIIHNENIFNGVTTWGSFLMADNISITGMFTLYLLGALYLYTWNPNDLDFWRSTPQNKAQTPIKTRVIWVPGTYRGPITL